MPKDHLVRKVAKAIDFEFIRDEVAHLYCHDNGRPAVDSVRLFKYDADKDCYICPMEQLLIYSTTTRESYHTYKSNPAYCRTCPLRLQCTQNQKAERLITRHIYQAAMDNTNAVRLSEQGEKNSTNAELKPSSAALRMPNNTTDTVTPVTESSQKCKYNASLRQCAKYQENSPCALGFFTLFMAYSSPICGNGKEIPKTDRLSGYLERNAIERDKTAKNKPIFGRKSEKVGVSVV